MVQPKSSTSSDSQSKQILAVNPIVYCNIYHRCQFECPICRESVNEPFYCQSCSNIFCNSCISKWTDYKEEPKCPLCRSAWINNQDQVLDRLSSIIKCSKDDKNFRYECSYCRIEFKNGKDLLDHYKECSFIIHCNGCKKGVYLKHFESHLSENLTCRKVYADDEFGFECRFCKLDLGKNVENLNTHSKECLRLTTCSKCKKLMLKEHYESHKIKCEFMEVPCPRCEQPVVKRKMNQHLEYCGKSQCAVCDVWLDDFYFQRHFHCPECDKSINADMKGYEFCYGCGKQGCNGCLSKCRGCDKYSCEECYIYNTTGCACYKKRKGKKY